LRYRRFDDAIESHQKAAEFLEESFKIVTISKSLESLKLQRDYHLKQKELIQIKKNQFDKYRKAIELQKQKAATTDTVNAISSKDKMEASCQIQMAIYKAIESADSLLDFLSTRNTSDVESLKSIEESEEVNTEMIGDTITLGIKKPKDESVVIEELRTLNQQLHILVYQLVTQLDESVQETEALREKVKVLENERTQHMHKNEIYLKDVVLGKEAIKKTEKDKNTLKVDTDVITSYIYKTRDISPDEKEKQNTKKI